MILFFFFFSTNLSLNHHYCMIILCVSCVSRRKYASLKWARFGCSVWAIIEWLKGEGVWVKPLNRAHWIAQRTKVFQLFLHIRMLSRKLWAIIVKQSFERGISWVNVLGASQFLKPKPLEWVCGGVRCFSESFESHKEILSAGMISIQHSQREKPRRSHLWSFTPIR